MTRRAQHLDGFPSIEQLVEKAKTSKHPLAKQALAQLESARSPFVAPRAPTRDVAGSVAELARARRCEQVVMSRGRVIVPVQLASGLVEAWGARLSAGGVRCVLPIAPRTKKNGSKNAYFGIAKKGSPYAVYRDAMCSVLAPMIDVLALPLPPGAYNLAAQFYVDKPGERADRFGLEQALADVLQLAGVVDDDRQFRAGDGTRIIVGDPLPRVEFTITPL